MAAITEVPPMQCSEKKQTGHQAANIKGSSCIEKCSETDLARGISFSALPFPQLMYRIRPK